jgi:cold shock protein
MSHGWGVNARRWWWRPDDKLDSHSHLLTFGHGVGDVMAGAAKGMHMAMTGKVKWFDTKKGYGFIEAEEGGGDVFVHFGDIIGEGYKSLQQGDRVQFEVGETPKGKKAAQVRRLEPS